MRTTLHKSLLCMAAVVMVFPLASLAQLTKADFEARIGMESHIGHVTGHAKNAQYDYRRYCVGCHGDRGDGNGGEFSLGRSEAPRFPAGHLQMPLHSYRNAAYGSGPVRHDQPGFGPLQHAAVERFHGRSRKPTWSPG